MDCCKKKRVKKVTKRKTEKVIHLNPDALRYLRFKIGGKYTAERHMFLKKDPSKENTLIVSNIPAFVGEEVVLAILNQFAPSEVEDSFVQRSSASDSSLSQGQLTMSIAFEKPEAVIQALALCQDVGPFTVTDFLEEPEFPSVLKDSTTLYQKLFPSEDQIQEIADTYVERYDTEQAEARKAAKRKYSQPDEDGWITVTKGKKAAKSVKLRKEDVPLMGGLNGKKKKIDLAYYTFQVKKNRQEKAQELLKKFEEDRKRIAQLKQARNFRPA
uniref:RRP7 domain-containing protein n=1 Tax=Caenorhabditis japonica TaxID=281687 RepID=A0A8R1I500_CAEJA